MALGRRLFSWVPLPRPAKRSCRGIVTTAAISVRMIVLGSWGAVSAWVRRIVSIVRLRGDGGNFMERSIVVAAGKV